MLRVGMDYSPKQTSQREPIPGREDDMVVNEAGGYVFPVDDWVRLDRFLVLGTEGGTYYASERQLTKDNAQVVARCLKSDGLRTVGRIVEISRLGRAPKNDPALFALAMAASEAFANRETRKAAFEGLLRVARIGTHLFHFVEYAKSMRGWGRGMRRAIDYWYWARNDNDLGYQLVKYRQRDGWSHRDLLRLSHPVPTGDKQSAVFKWVVSGGLADVPAGVYLPDMIIAFEAAQIAKTTDEIIGLIKEHDLTWEMIPSEHLKCPDVWKALLSQMPMTALIRNLARMTANGTLKPMSEEAQFVAKRLADPQAIARARIHPIAVLAALLTYKAGHGVRGQLTWTPVTSILDALDGAFYLAFGNVKPTDKRLMLAIDVSSSMASGTIASVPFLTPNVAAAAMSLVTAAIERDCMIMGFAKSFRALPISPKMRLDAAARETQDRSFGGTDASLPMQYALEKGIEVDAFLIYTDSQTWCGDIHPTQALRKYREKMGIPAKLIVVAMTSNGFSLADPDDGGMLDVCGFDTATPNLISDFVTGDLGVTR